VRITRTSLAWPLIGACLLASGCSVSANGILGKFCRTVFYEPAVYCKRVDDHRANKRLRQMAHEAWEQFTMCHAVGSYCPDFAAGFTDGYYEYLYAGGNGAPPPVPPRHYWNDAWRTELGQQAINEWYSGYRTGAEVAMSYGRREIATVPAPHRMACAAPPLSDGVVPVPSDPTSLPGDAEPQPDGMGPVPADPEQQPADAPVSSRRRQEVACAIETGAIQRLPPTETFTAAAPSSWR
jgi:hypothetical protein